MGHGQSQIFPSLEHRADAVAAALAGGLVTGGPPGVLPAGSGR